MLIDTRTTSFHPDSARTGVCIIGGGAAGISLARELSGGRLRVVLLEAGGIEPRSDGLDTYDITPESQPKLYRDPSRSWYFGGNTNHWFGHCTPRPAADFEVKDWIPNSGWPLGFDDLRPFYERAQAMSGLGDYRWYDPEACRPHLVHPPADVDPALLRTRISQVCPVLSFAELHRQHLGDSEEVQILLGTRAARLRTNAAGTSVEAVEVIDSQGVRSHIEAEVFVLACGGVENPRLLLCSNDPNPNGLGNDNDLVGRFFMEHWYLNLGLGEWNGGDLELYTLTGGREAHLHDREMIGDACISGELVLSDKVMQEHRVPGLSIWFGRDHGESPSVGAMRRIAKSVLANARTMRFWSDTQLVLSDPNAVFRHVHRKLTHARTTHPRLSLRVQLEQVPDPENRILLSEDRDRLGERRAELQLSLGEAERRAQVPSLRILADALGLNGAQLARQGRLMLDSGRVGFLFHHMGTTRMSESPDRGVVDRDCRVHGISNLYVAGSSVFPTGGTAGPTLTIVALALRLADHLRESDRE